MLHGRRSTGLLADRMQLLHMHSCCSHIAAAPAGKGHPRLRLHINGSLVLHCWPTQAQTSTLPVGLNSSDQEAARQLSGAVEVGRSNLLKAE